MGLFTEGRSDCDRYRFEHMNSKAEEPIDVTNLNISLRNLVIIGQPLYTVPDIKYLNNLEDLWFVDCSIQNVDNITNCKNLRRLYLYTNSISKIPEYLSHLQHLKVLWLAGNRIKSISECEFPLKLEELNLADNEIITIKNSFRNCNYLESLNLSGNPLGTIFEICHLRVIKNLKSLSLYDPLHKISDITKLCNYRSFIVNVLPNLEQLDSFNIDDREIELTKVFYSNKHIYYAMMKMDAYYEYWACKRLQNSVDFEDLTNIKKQLHSLSSKYNRTKREEQNPDTDLWESMQWILDNGLKLWEKRCKEEQEAMEELLNVKISNLEMELQYFGNIKFQIFYKNSEVSAACQDILNNFICPYLKKKWNLKGICIALVTLVINSKLYLYDGAQFMLDILEEQQSGELFILCEPNYIQTSYETFYSEFRNTILSQETDERRNMITQCFGRADKSFQMKNCSSNNEHLTSRRIAALSFFQSWATEATQYHDKSNEDFAQKCEVRSIREAYKSTPILLIEYSYTFEGDDENTLFKSKDLPLVELYCSKQSAIEFLGSETKSWYTLTKLVLSHQNLSTLGTTNALPNVKELDVSYNNFFSISEICNLFPNLEILNAAFNDISMVPTYSFNMESLQVIDLSWNSFTNLFPILLWLHESAPKTKDLCLKYNLFMDIHDTSHDVYLASRYLDELYIFNHICLEEKNISGFESYVFDVLDENYKIFELSEEQLEPKYLFSNTSWDEECCNAIKSGHVAINSEGKIKCINLMGEKQFKNVIFKNPVEDTASLKISRNKIMETEFLQSMSRLIDLNLSFNLLTTINQSFLGFKNIVKLNLSGNYISSMDELKAMDLSFLKVLDVSKNRLRSIKGIENAINIEELYIAFNKIDILENYLFIKHFKQLKIIDMRENDLHNMDILRNYLVFHLPVLQYINGTTISENELLEANHAFGGVLDIEFLQSQYKYKDFKVMQHISVLNSSIKRVSLSGGQFQNLTSMNLENNGLVSMADLLPLGNLKFLSLTGNQISKFGEAPESMFFKKLEEVHLNSNHIYSLEPLQLHRMPKLKTLFLQDNELTTIRGIERLINLQHLILDNNRITRIQTGYIRKLSNLRNLFIESNCIDTLEFLPILKRIVKLYLRNNRIQDIKTLSYLKYLTRIEEITFSGNPVCRNNETYVKLLIYLPNINCVDGVKLETVSTETAYYQ